MAAGVASVDSAVVTRPTDMPLVLFTISEIFSTFGSSKGSFVESSYTPIAFTTDLCPVA
eukprot:TRINITY_DN17904_c0_g1_i1.p2 TRINITY_DN17904_c0_g1~~TRINITY_DN17904_c0_g1_i1.p2  ORF type:complete len:59 (+),score=3.40 TRINITY_DN17904_c0_g1_i1:140-316(+)